MRSLKISKFTNFSTNITYTDSLILKINEFQSSTSLTVMQSNGILYELEISYASQLLVWIRSSREMWFKIMQGGGNGRIVKRIFLLFESKLDCDSVASVLARLNVNIKRKPNEKTDQVEEVDTSPLLNSERIPLSQPLLEASSSQPQPQPQPQSHSHTQSKCIEDTFSPKLPVPESQELFGGHLSSSPRRPCSPTLSLDTLWPPTQASASSSNSLFAQSQSQPRAANFSIPHDIFESQPNPTPWQLAPSSVESSQLQPSQPAAFSLQSNPDLPQSTMEMDVFENTQMSVFPPTEEEEATQPLDTFALPTSQDVNFQRGEEIMDRILAKKQAENGDLLYLVGWKNYPEEQATWKIYKSSSWTREEKEIAFSFERSQIDEQSLVSLEAEMNVQVNKELKEKGEGDLPYIFSLHLLTDAQLMKWVEKMKDSDQISTIVSSFKKDYEFWNRFKF